MIPLEVNSDANDVKDFVNSSLDQNYKCKR